MPVSHTVTLSRPPPPPLPPFPLGAVFPPELLIKIIRMAIEPQTPWHATDLVRMLIQRAYLPLWMRVSRTWRELVEPIWLERVEIKSPAASNSLLSRVEQNTSMGEMVRTVSIGPTAWQEPVRHDWEMDWVNDTVQRGVRCFPFLSQIEIFGSRPPGEETALRRPSSLIIDSLGGSRSRSAFCARSHSLSQFTSPSCDFSRSTSAQIQMYFHTFGPSASRGAERRRAFPSRLCSRPLRACRSARSRA